MQHAAEPTEFHYWQNLARPSVKFFRAMLRQTIGFDPAPSDAVVRDFAAMYFDADPLAEAFIDEVYLQRGSAAGRVMLETALAQGAAAVPNPPASLLALFEDLTHPPAWLDWAQIDRGARAFRRYGTAVFRFAGAVTLEGYAESSVAKPLALTGAYAGATARKRFLETVAFWIAVSEPDGLRPGAPGLASALRVRMMHVFVRRKIAAHAEWNQAAWGVPISQGDALLTLMGGSFAPGVALHALGYLPSKRDILAMMHFWRYVGHLLGVRPRWYPSTLPEAVQLSFVTMVKGAHTAGDDGIALCQAYAKAFEPQATVPAEPLRDQPPKRLRDRVGARLFAEWEHRLHLGYTRLFTSPATYRHNRLPSAGPWVALPLLQFPLRASAEILRRMVPPLEAIADRRARQQRSAWFAKQMGGRSAEYRPVERFVR